MTFREGRTGSTACKPEMNIFLNPCPWERPTDDTLPHNFDKNKESLEKMVDAYQKSKHLYLHHSKLVFVWDLKIHYFKLIRYSYKIGWSVDRGVRGNLDKNSPPNKDSGYLANVDSCVSNISPQIDSLILFADSFEFLWSSVGALIA